MRVCVCVCVCTMRKLCLAKFKVFHYNVQWVKYEVIMMERWREPKTQSRSSVCVRTKGTMGLWLISRTQRAKREYLAVVWYSTRRRCKALSGLVPRHLVQWVICNRYEVIADSVNMAEGSADGRLFMWWKIFTPLVVVRYRIAVPSPLALAQ